MSFSLVCKNWKAKIDVIKEYMGVYHYASTLACFSVANGVPYEH